MSELLTPSQVELQKNNPLHGLKLEKLLNEIVDYYGWETLAYAMNINCFKTNPSITSSLKFLRKTQWAREKVEAFYLYKFKHLPRPSDAQFKLSPRDRIVPMHQSPGEPVKIEIKVFKPRPGSEYNEADHYRDIRRNDNSVFKRRNNGDSDVNTETKAKVDPWAKWRN